MEPEHQLLIRHLEEALGLEPKFPVVGLTAQRFEMLPPNQLHIMAAVGRHVVVPAVVLGLRGKTEIVALQSVLIDGNVFELIVEYERDSGR
jgi:hypothetical protein